MRNTRRYARPAGGAGGWSGGAQIKLIWVRVRDLKPGYVPAGAAQGVDPAPARSRRQGFRGSVRR
jgi:hypothetical protein